MNKRKLQLLSALFITSLLSPLSLADAIGTSIGMHGIALDYQKAFSQHLSSRIIFSDMPLKRDVEEDDIEYEVEYDRTNFGVLLDYHPMAGSFHISGGIFTGDHNWIMKASSTTGEFDIGDQTYTASDLHLKAQVAFAKAEPYLGFGWGNTIGGRGLSANLDIGILYVGQPTVSYQASGTVNDGTNEVNVASYAEFQGNLEKERANLEDDLEDIKFMPVIQFGLAYQF